MHVWKRLHWVSLIIGALSIILPMVFWKWIPDEIPMHYNAKGIVDHWADKSSLILIFFCIAMLMGLMSLVVYLVKINMQSKYTKEVEKSELTIVYPAVILMNLALQCMFAYIVFCVVTCRPLGNLFLPVVLAIIFVPMFWMLYQHDKLRMVSKEQKRKYKESERSEEGIAYRTAVDLWLVIILGGCEALMLWLFLWPLISEGTFEWLLLLSFIGTTVVLLPLCNIKYILYSDHLLISMGWYGKVRIRYEDITRVEKTMNPISSAAMSLRRIQIDYVEKGIHRFVLISPNGRKRFIEELEKRRNRNGAIE